MVEREEADITSEMDMQAVVPMAKGRGNPSHVKPFAHVVGGSSSLAGKRVAWNPTRSRREDSGGSNTIISPKGWAEVCQAVIPGNNAIGGGGDYRKEKKKHHFERAKTDGCFSPNHGGVKGKKEGGFQRIRATQGG